MKICGHVRYDEHKIYTRVSLGKTGHYLDHNMHSEWRSFTCFLYPGVATIHLTYKCAVLCTVHDLCEGFDLKEDSYLHLPVLIIFFFEPNPTNRDTQKLEIR